MTKELYEIDHIEKFERSNDWKEGWEAGAWIFLSFGIIFFVFGLCDSYLPFIIIGFNFELISTIFLFLRNLKKKKMVWRKVKNERKIYDS